MNTITPNPEEVVVTPESTPESGTEQTETVTTGLPQDIETIDYREKFIQSAQGAHTLLDENKTLKARLAELETNPNADIPSGLPTHTPNTDVLYPGFEQLDPEAQANLLAYSNAVTKKAEDNILARPSIAYAERTYNESKWESAFAVVSAKYPELVAAHGDFKSQYFNVNNVPDNMSEILDTMAKSYLFDKSRDLGIEEGKLIAERVQLESPTGGDKTPTVHRSLSDWQRMAAQNPAKFATMKKEYEADIASGKLRE